MNGTPINWGPVAAGSKLLSHPVYQKWSYNVISQMDATAINNLKADLLKMRLDNDNADCISYLCWVLRVVTLINT